MRAVTKLALSLAAGAALVAAASTASAATALLNPASPMHYVGHCPGTIKFTGWITSTTPGPVKFQWFRSDGGTGPVQTMMFGAGVPPRQPISDTWTLGGIPALPSYAGWEAVRILSPAPASVSNKAPFTLKCVQSPLTHGG
jgi:hypothetical protein